MYERGGTIETGDCLAVMRTMPDQFVQCVVTSPPYLNLRDYKVEGQIGQERSPKEFVAKMVEVFREIWRILRKDGVVWLNLGDSYAASGKGCNPPFDKYWKQGTNIGSLIPGRTTPPEGFKPKDLMLIPHRTAIALQEDGWWVRQDIPWAKGVSFAETYHGSSMPESVADRPSRSHEYVFLLTKSENYFYDKYAVVEPIQTATHERAMRAVSDHHKNLNVPGQTTHSMHRARAAGEGYQISSGGGRNLRSVWCINSEAFPGAHYATFPTKLVDACVRLGTSDKGSCSQCGAPWRRVVEPSPEYAERLHGDWSDHEKDQAEGRGHFELINGGRSNGRPTKRDGHGCTAEYLTTGWRKACKCSGSEIVPCLVLDPFSGAGTTVMTALRLGRRGVGIELSPEFAEMSRERIAKDELNMRNRQRGLFE